MSDKNCNCDVISLGNTGIPDCSLIADVAAFPLLDMAKDSSGAPKERLKSDLTTFATLEPLLNAASPLDRIYPIGKFENVEHNREDDVFWSANSGKQAFVREGFKTFRALHVLRSVVVWVTFLTVILIVEQGFAGTDWLSEVIIVPFMVFQLISALKNASMAGYIKASLLNSILDRIDNHKGIRFKDEESKE